MNDIYKSTLIEWCDKLCELQITNRPEPYFFGALHCPACGRFHGRIADSVYPLLTAAKVTGDMKYTKAAENVFTWTENNVLRENGSIFNDQNSNWSAVTTFLCTSIAEALIYCDEVISDEFKKRLTLQLKKSLDFCADYIPTCDTVINYKLSVAGTLAAGAKALGDESYMEKAREIVKKAPHYFSEDGLLWGEYSDYKNKKGFDALEILSPKGCRAVDIGYDIEETIPSLCLYAQLAEDKKMQEFLVDKLYAFLPFMLSDGGWDNSFGIRMMKWTYWGSRTSDGCQGAYARFADVDPMFREVAHRSFMQYVACSKDGMLYGGPMYIEENELPCTHHLFCHAKSAADMVNLGFTYDTESELPFDKGEIYKYYPSADLHLLRADKWRASVSGFDLPSPSYKYSTASLTLLQEDRYGTIFAASVPYYFLEEANNQQFPRYTQYALFEICQCQTPRIVCGDYTNIYNRECAVDYNEADKLFIVSGQLKNDKFEGDVDYKMTYQFGDEVTITSVVAEDSTLILPIVAGSHDEVKIEGNILSVKRNGCTLTLKADGEITSDYSRNRRNFNPCGGFATYPVKIEIPKGKESKVVVAVK